jgi:hypothetical protein
VAEVHAVELADGDVARAAFGIGEPGDLHEMVDSAAAVPGCAWPVDAGRCTAGGDSGSATDPFRRVPSSAAGRVQTGAAGVVGSTI